MHKMGDNRVKLTGSLPSREMGLESSESVNRQPLYSVHLNCIRRNYDDRSHRQYVRSSSALMQGYASSLPSRLVQDRLALDFEISRDHRKFAGRWVTA